MTEAFEILLVEDYEPDVKFTARLFQRNRIANRLHVVHDGAEALDFVFSRGVWAHRADLKRPLVVLMDIRLPKLDGWEVLRQIKRDPATRGIPVIMISGSLFSEEKERCEQMGAVASLSKPLRMDELQHALASCGMGWAMAGQDEVNRALN